MMDKICLAKDTRVTKLVRATMEEISYFLNINQDCSHKIKIIHLLRDPRGRINSLTENGVKKRSFSLEKISAMCKRQIQDIKTRQKLQEIYPNMFMELLYEDISSNPLAVGNELYKFTYNTSMQVSAINWLKEHTESKAVHENYILKKNSTATSIAWQTQINPQLLHNIQIQCKDLIKYLNLPIV